MTKTIGFDIDPLVMVDIVSTRDAAIAVVVAEIDGVEYEWRGTSKRDPQDKHVPEIGEKLALSRALNKAAKQLARQADGLVKCIDDNTQASLRAKSLRNKKHKKDTAKSGDVEVTRVTSTSRSQIAT